MKVTRVYRQPIDTKDYGHFIEDRSINDINDSLNISVQAPPIDMDRISDKMDFSNSILTSLFFHYN